MPTRTMAALQESRMNAPSIAATLHPTLRSRAPGLLLAVAIGLLALLLGHWAPIIGGPVFGIVLGIVVRNAFAPDARFTPGIQFGGKQVLQWSIIALGFGLSLTQVAKTGLDSLSVTTIIRPDDHDTAFAISTIFLFNVVAVLLCPMLGHLMHLSDLGVGLWAGTAINDTSSVVAAGYSYSKAAGDFATIVKLTRATLIIPVCLVLVVVVAARERRTSQASGSTFSLARIFPWFILWFIVASAIRTTGLITAAMQPMLHAGAEFLIIVALTAVVLSADIRRMVS